MCIRGSNTRREFPGGSRDAAQVARVVTVQLTPGKEIPMSALSPSASLRTARRVRLGSIAASVSCVCVALSAQAAESGASKERVKALEEVIVTAQRRAEVLQDVPIAIT